MLRSGTAAAGTHGAVFWSASAGNALVYILYRTELTSPSIGTGEKLP